MIRAQKRKRVALPHFRKEAHGQASIEFIFTVVFLVLFILGMIEVVMLVYTYSVLADSAKEGVRYAVVHGSGSASGSGPGCGDSTGANVKTVVTNYAEYSFHSTSGMTVNVTYPESACTAPSLVRVTVSYPYQPFFGLGWPPSRFARRRRGASPIEGTQGRIGRKTAPLRQEKCERTKCDSAACLKSHAAGHSNEPKVVPSLRGKKSYRAFFCTEEIPRGVYHD